MIIEQLKKLEDEVNAREESFLKQRFSWTGRAKPN